MKEEIELHGDGARSERQEPGHTPTPWEVQAGNDYFITAQGYPKDPSPVVDNNLDDDVLVALVGNQRLRRLQRCQERRANGQCITCGKPALPSSRKVSKGWYKFCERHQKAALAAQRKFRGVDPSRYRG